jgi:hypothetical protein
LDVPKDPFIIANLNIIIIPVADQKSAQNKKHSHSDMKFIDKIMNKTAEFIFRKNIIMVKKYQKCSDRPDAC